MEGAAAMSITGTRGSTYQACVVLTAGTQAPAILLLSGTHSKPLLWLIYGKTPHTLSFVHPLTRYAQYVSYNDTHPGGPVSSVSIISSNSTINQTYHIVGDRSSISAVLTALIHNCSVQDTSSQIAAFDADAATPAVLPEQVVQWYRASSFALSLDKYNNSASSRASMPANNNTAPPPTSADTPLPEGVDAPFLACLNGTIAASVPLMMYQRPSHKLGASAIASIVVGSVVGAILLMLFAVMCCRCGRRSVSKTTDGGVRAVGTPMATTKARLTLTHFFTRNGRGKYTSLEHPNETPSVQVTQTKLGQPPLSRPESPVWSVPEPKHS